MNHPSITNPEAQDAPCVWLAYRVSHLYGGAYEDGTENVEHLIDADPNALALTRRLNEHFAHPDTVRYERGNVLQIPAFATKSNRVHGSGGGCSYYAHLELRKAPRLGGQGK